MTSEDRREGRYQRRKARREQKKSEDDKFWMNFDWVFSYHHLYTSYRKCRKGVIWKASVQRYIQEAPLRVYRVWLALQQMRWKPMKFWEFDLIERGKKRHIQSVHINDRVVQRCLCDYCLVPIFGRSFIYDNSACMEGKGYLFASKRLMRHLREYYRKYGNNGYVLLFDFRHYFESIPHETIRKMVGEKVHDERLRKVTMSIVNRFNGEKGLGLGSQISQILALAAADPLDHYLKDQLGLKWYARYNDDGYILHPDKEYLKKLMEEIRKVCEGLRIELHPKKTQIVKISHGFTFLKARYYLLDNGKIIRKLPKKSAARERRKIGKLIQKYKHGDIALDSIRQSWQSWDAYARTFNAGCSRQSVLQKYRRYLEQGGI